MQKDFEDYEDYESPPFRWMSVVVLLLAVAGFFSLAWYAYYSGTSNVQYEEAVVIEADEAPLKVEPDDEGGMEFPHQEKTIYDAVESYNQAEPKVEVAEEVEEPIIPDDMPEKSKPSTDEKVAAIIQKAVEHTQIEMGNEVEPVGGPDEEAAATPKAAADKADVKTIAEQEVVVKMEPVNKVPEPKPAPKLKEQVIAQMEKKTPAAPQPLIEKKAPMSVTETKTKQPSAPVSLGSIPKESPKPKAPAKVESKPTADGELTISKPVPMVDKTKPEPKPAPAAKAKASPTAHKLQLAAFRSNAEAESNWARIQKANSTVLGGMPHEVQRADLGAKGVYYRLRVSGFASKQAAIAACTKLKAAKQGCFYTK